VCVSRAWLSVLASGLRGGDRGSPARPPRGPGSARVGGRGRDRLALLQMEGSEELERSLLTQPWASVRFGESAFLAKACFGDAGYILLISDLSGVWYESADAGAVGQRSKVSVWEVQGSLLAAADVAA